MDPSIAFAYGSSSSLFGLHRVPVGRVVGTVHPEAVALPGGDVGREAVPDEPVHLGEDYAGLLTGLVEQAQFDPLGDLAESVKFVPDPS